VRDLVQTQQKTGGWAQTTELAADAYATGSALVMLHQAGGMPVGHSVYQRGLAFLVATQQPDGSWFVGSRSRPFQTYFESGFPHGKDQFISIAASSWATAALALACPPTEKGVGTLFGPYSPRLPPALPVRRGGTSAAR
jgi:squalene cyclase